MTTKNYMNITGKFQETDYVKVSSPQSKDAYNLKLNAHDVYCILQMIPLGKDRQERVYAPTLEKLYKSIKINNPWRINS